MREIKAVNSWKYRTYQRRKELGIKSKQETSKSVRKTRENKGKKIKDDHGGGKMKKAAVVSHFVTVC